MNSTETHQSYVVGRLRELSLIDTQLRAERDLIIISPPLTGLSTVLYQIRTHIITADHLHKFQVFNLDCQLISKGKESFHKHLCQNLIDLLGITSPEYTDFEEVRLVEFLEGLLVSEPELRLVIVIDNLQFIPKNEISLLLEQIRVISESRHENKLLKQILFILGGQCLDLHQLDPELTSPFNIAEIILLGDLDEQSALELTKNILSQSSRHVSDITAQYICYLTGNHAYLTEQICFHLIYDTVAAVGSSSRINFAIVDQVAETLCREGRDRLLRLITETLKQMPFSLRECLRQILNGARYDARKETPELKELAQIGLINRGGHSPIWKIRNPIFSMFLRQQPDIGQTFNENQFMPRRLFTNLEGYRILYELENDLRDFVFCKLFGEFDESWWDKVDPNIGKSCQRVKKKELENGWTPNEELPELAYSYFPNLKTTIENEHNWERVFSRHFKPRDIFMGYFKKLESIRNRIAHNRPLTDREIEQLEFIAGEFRDCMRDAPIVDYNA